MGDNSGFISVTCVGGPHDGRELWWSVVQGPQWVDLLHEQGGVYVRAHYLRNGEKLWFAGVQAKDTEFDLVTK